MRCGDDVHADAPQTLIDSGLPRLSLLPLARPEDLRKLPFDLYVRATQGPSPGRLSAPQLRELLEVSASRNYTAVEFVDSIAGATCIRSGRTMLIEFAHGHLSSILRKAHMAHRFLIVQDDYGVRILRDQTFNQWEYIDPATLTPTSGFNAEISSDEVADIAVEIAELVFDSRLPDRTLTEIMVTQQGPRWVDARPYAWAIDYGGLLKETSVCIYKSDTDWPIAQVRPLVPEKWDPVDVPASTSGTALFLDGRPLTCHFVTYSLERGLRFLYNHGGPD